MNNNYSKSYRMQKGDGVIPSPFFVWGYERNMTILIDILSRHMYNRNVNFNSKFRRLVQGNDTKSKGPQRLKIKWRN